MKTYTPRRCSTRWLDADCPDGVLCIFDHPDCGDRYTVFYRAPESGSTYADMWLGYRAMSANPFHPQGIGLYGGMEAHQVASYRYAQKHRYTKWSSLPEDVQRCVRQDLSETP